jgi:hypothetical protein
MYKGVQGLGSGEFPLPTFDENAGINPVSHLRQLEEFFRFRGVQQKHWLTVAKRSITGSMSKQWLEATSLKFTSYEQFKKEFLATWWSASQQGLIKCSLYQSKYNHSAGLSLTVHFLKYVTPASYLEPNLSDYEITEAIRCHYPVEIQKLLVTTKMNTIAETLEVLKRLEMLEERMTNFRVETNQEQRQQNSFPNRVRNERQRYELGNRNKYRGRERYCGRSVERGRGERPEHPPGNPRSNGQSERERSPWSRQEENWEEN